MVEEGDFPTTDDNADVRTAFTLSGLVEKLADLIETFRANLNLRSAAMHRVAITVGGGMFWAIVGLTLIVGVVLGLDWSERAAQARQWNENVATLQRDWQVNTDTLQREWQRDLQRAHLDNIRLLEEYQKAERESRVQQQQTMDLAALLLREGHRQAGDATNGPSGNIDYHRHRKEK